MKYLDQFGNETDTYYGFIYITIDQKHNKVYIGQRKGKPTDRGNKNYFGSGVIISKIKKSRGTYFLKRIVLGVCYSAKELTECETECKYFFDVWNPLVGYNIAIIDYNPMSGRKQTIEHINKRASALKGKKLSNETKLKIGIAGTGKKITLEQSQKLSKLRKGRKLKPFTEETKNKMSISAKKRKRKPLSEETKEKISQTLLGHKHLEESKKKMSKFQKERKRKPHSEEAKKNMSIAAKKRVKKEDEKRIEMLEKRINA